MLFIFFPILIGMLAWAVATTIILILILIKRWLLAKLAKFQCCSKCVPPAPSTSDTPSVHYAPPSTPVSRPPDAHLNPTFTPQTAGLDIILTHTPPSLATTPSTITPTPPSTVRSTKPLISPEEPVSSRTRSKTPRKLSL